MPDLSMQTIDAIVTQALVGQGASPDILLARQPDQGRALLLLRNRPHPKGRSLEWITEEDTYLISHVATQTDIEIGAVLGRTATAVHLRRERDLHLLARSKRPDELTCNQIAEGLQVDVHSIMRLIDRGLLPGRRYNLGREVYRMVQRRVLLRWLVNPLNWIYFSPGQVGIYLPVRTKSKYDFTFWSHAGRLARLAQSRWPDAWLSPSQAGALHGVKHQLINNAIHHGRLHGVKWGNWHILRSEALRPGVRFCVGSGNTTLLVWSEAGDAFMLLAKAIGLADLAIERLMGAAYTERVQYRLTQLRRSKSIRRITAKHLAYTIDIDRQGQLFMDWKPYRKRFPALACALDAFKYNEPLTEQQRRMVRGVLKVWAVRFYRMPDRAALLAHLNTASGQVKLQALCRQMQRGGVNIYGKPGG